MASFQTIQMHHIDDAQTNILEMALTAEAPLKMMINQKYVTQTMRTPGDEKANVLGFLFATQKISSLRDLKSFSLSSSGDTDTAHVLTHQSPEGMLDYRKDIKESCISLSSAYRCIQELSNCQPLRAQTKSTHGAILFDSSLKRLASKEDVGRHNALDKVIGQTILDQTIHRAHILVLSSRVSHELMSKVIPTPIQFILSVSRPTSLAVEIARKVGIHLACLSKDGGLFVFTGLNAFRLVE